MGRKRDAVTLVTPGALIAASELVLGSVGGNRMEEGAEWNKIMRRVVAD